VRFGDYKLLRRGLATKKPSEWELYDLSKDPGEAMNLANEHPDLVEQGQRILREQTDTNAVFPVNF
jgi:arylsulfatase A-like enzyme